jgi:hypothetical protein
MSATPFMRFHTMELVVEFEPILDATGYDPSLENFSGNSNPVSAHVPSQSNPQTA